VEALPGTAACGGRHVHASQQQAVQQADARVSEQCEPRQSPGLSADQRSGGPVQSFKDAAVCAGNTIP